MSKTPLRSLRTIAVAAGLIVTQGMVLTQQSSPVSANTGTNIQLYNNVYTSVAGTPTTLTVVGSGFAPNATVNVTFNAAVANNNAVSGVHATPPSTATPPWPAPGQTPLAPGIQGDTIEGGQGPAAGPALPLNPQPNAIDVLVKTDSGGNLIGTVPQVQPAVPCTNIGGPGALCPGARRSSMSRVARHPAVMRSPR